MVPGCNRRVLEVNMSEVFMERGSVKTGRGRRAYEAHNAYPAGRRWQAWAAVVPPECKLLGNRTRASISMDGD